MYTCLGGPQGQSGQVWNISPPRGFDPWTVQAAEGHYIDYAIPAHKIKMWGHDKMDTTYSHNKHEPTAHPLNNCMVTWFRKIQ
jgi:hypothetical protein